MFYQLFVVLALMSLYEVSKTRVSVDSEISEEFEFKVGMHHVSVPSHFLLTVVMEVIIELAKNVLSELLYAGELVLCRV